MSRQTETLMQALAATYASNPALNAERAALRSVDEGVARALSGFRPRIVGTADVGLERRKTVPTARSVGAENVEANTTEGHTWPSGYSAQINQTLFAGFQNINATREAEANVRAGRETLRGVEQVTLLDAVIAFVDVVRDQAVVKLRENNVTVLTEQQKATQDRFDVGEVTRTDLAQSQASRANALSALSLAQANLRASRAIYERVVGHPPGNLVEPPPLSRLLPSRVDEAIYGGDNDHPAILSAVFLEEASGFAVKRIIGELLPQVTLEATHTERFDQTLSIEEQETSSIVGRLNVPIYQGGEVAARVRQAKDTNLQRRRDLDQARVLVRADVVASWGRLVAARAQIESDQAAVDATAIALSGVREEEKVGQRTVLDVLDAEQAALNAQVLLVTTRRNLVVASYTLLAAIGKLDALTLNLNVPYYDPTEHYHRVRGKWWGLNAEKPGEGYRPPPLEGYRPPPPLLTK